MKRINLTKRCYGKRENKSILLNLNNIQLSGVNEVQEPVFNNKTLNEPRQVKRNQNLNKNNDLRV